MRLLPARPKKTEERRRRRYGFCLFFAGLIAIFFLVRAIPADWEIGPSPIDTAGNAPDQASLYFADDPRAPFWLLVPTFNLPPRFFATRPNSSPRPVALGPTASPSSSASTSPSASTGPTPPAGPTPTPGSTPTTTPTANPTPTPTPTPTSTPTPPPPPPPHP